MRAQAGSEIETSVADAPIDDRRLRFADLCEETTGFGEIEWRTFRDLLVRPRTALEAYLVHGPTGGRRYARPFGFYVAMCGVLMFYIFLNGGMTSLVAQLPPDKLALWVERSGKAHADFVDDVDSWMGLVVVPVMSVFYALFSAPLLKWWSGLDWRRSFRATFVLLCAWTAPILLLGPLPLMKGFELPAAMFMFAALMAAFLRMGRGLWFDGWPMGVAKGVMLYAVLMLGAVAGMIPSFQIGLLGAAYGN